MSNKIGIKVQVEFPSATEIREKLAEKWRSVKDDFTGKINVDVDLNSMRKMKAKIQKSLDEKTFDLKMDTSHAITAINKIDKELLQFDKNVGKTREIKLKFDATSLQKPFEEILKASRKVEEEQDKINRNTNRETGDLQKQLGQYDKITRKYKEIDGKMVNVKVKTDYIDDGIKTSRTIDSKGVTEDVSEDKLGNRLADLKEIESLMKSIHRLDVEQVNAEADYNAMLEKEKQIQQQQLGMLKEQYQVKHGMNAMDDNGTRELARQQQVTKELKEQLAFQKLIAQEDKGIANDVSKIAQLENKRHSIKMKLVNATQEEKEALRSQLTHFYDIQKSIEDTLGTSRKMTTEQEEQLGNIRNINKLELERARAKKEQAEADRIASAEQKRLAQEQKEANRQVISDLEAIHRLRLQIAKIESRRDAGGRFSQEDNLKLQLMKEQLDVQSKMAREDRNLLNSQGLITNETNDQLRTMHQINQAETQRVQSAQRLVAESDKTNDQYREWVKSEQNIARLRRDLVFAGMREKEVILEALGAEQAKSDAIRESLNNAKMLTKERHKEIQAIRETAKEQLQTNSARRIARERDQSFNDTGGLIDPYTVYAEGRQGIEAMLEPMLKIDEAFTRVAKVANASDETLQQFKDTSYDVASSLGVTADKYMMAVETWVTAGKTFQASQELAKISQIGSFVGNIEADDMVKFMSVPLESFADQGIKANDIINTMNETANNNAIEMEELGKAYMRSATTVKTAGVSFSELTGLITGAQEATRIGGERIGTSLKAISMNYNLIKSQVTPQQQSKFDFFDSIGMNLDDTTSLTDAIDQLHGKWEELKDEQKTTAVYYLAGKEHGNILNGIIDQWETVVKAEKEARQQLGRGVDGSAYIEFSKQTDSLRFKMAKLKSEWMKLMNTLGESDGFMSNLLGGVIKGLQTASDLAQNEAFMNVLKIIGAGIITRAGANLFMRVWDTMSTGGKEAVRTASELLFAWKNIGREIGEANVKMSSLATAQATAGVVGAVGGADIDGRGRRGGTPSRAGEVADGAGDLMAGMGGLGANLASRGGVKGIVKGGAKLVGQTAFKFIPFLGEALILMDIIGIDWWSPLEKGFEKIRGSAQQTGTEVDNMMKKFKGGNEYINGTVDKGRNGIESLRSQLDKDGATKKGVATDKGGMDSDKFLKFREQFNSQAEDLGLKVRVDINDTGDILNKIKQLETALDKLNSKAMVKIITKSDSLMNGDKGIKTTIDQIGKLKREINHVSDASKNMKKIRDSYPVDSKDYKLWNDRVKASERQLKQLRSEVSKSGNTFEAQKKAIIDNGTALMAQGKGISKVKMSSKEMVTTLQTMLPAYEKVKKSANTLGKYQKNLGTDYQFSKKELRSLIKEFPQYDTMKLKTLNTDKKVRKEVQKNVAERKKEKDAQAQTGEEALKATAKKVDGDKEAGKSVKKLSGTTKSAQQIVKDATDSSNGSTKESIKLTGDFTQKVKDIPAKKDTKIGIKVPEMSLLDKVKSFFSSNKSISATVNVVAKGLSKVSKFLGGGLGSSVAIGTPSTGSYAPRAISSASVASGSSAPVVGMGLGGDVGAVVDASTASKKSAPKKDPNAGSRVESEVWRYWNTEDKQSRLEAVMQSLERAITLAKDNQDKLISIYEKQISNTKQQKSNLGVYRNQKDSETNSVLGQLKKYGFRVNTKDNSISNLGHAKDLKGTSAEKANELLSKWHSLVGEITSINGQIRDLDVALTDLADKEKLARIQKEFDGWKKTLTKVDATLTSINNSTTQHDMRIGYVDPADKELALYENATALKDTQSNLRGLVSEFNKLSSVTLKYKENGEQFKDTLEKIGTSIKAQADNVVRYKMAIRDLQFARIADDMNEFQQAVDRNVSRNDNNTKNLQEGLLSGTKVTDLRSYNTKYMQIDRDNEYKSLAKQRIALEKEVDDALIGFAKKNIDRVKGVSQATLTINAKMYNEMLVQKSKYDAGKKSSTKADKTKYGDLIDIKEFDKSYADVALGLEKYFEDVRKKQVALRDKYNADMKKAKTKTAKDALTDKFIADGFGLDIEYFKAQMKANDKAIAELKNQLNDKNLTPEEAKKRQDLINQYEQANIDAQNKIKETVKARYEFEFSLMDDLIKKVADKESEVQVTLDLLNALGTGSNKATGAVLTALYGAEQNKNDIIKANVQSLQDQMKHLEEGSFEWNVLNDKLATYNQQLNDSNLQLISMNKNILANKFDASVGEIEKKLFNGKSLSAWTTHQQLWLSGLKKELALEKMYQRMADLGTSVNKDKLDLLDKQAEVSAFEMDYLNKQLDIVELQQKLDNVNKQRTAQTLQKNADGSWDWVYTVNQDDVRKAEDDLKQAKIDLQEMENKAKEDYVSQLQKIMTDAQNGEYDNVNDFKTAIDNLGEAFKGVLEKNPDLTPNIKELVDGFQKYLDDNNKVVAGTPVAKVIKDTAKTVGQELQKAFKDISSELGKIFADQIALILPKTSITPTAPVATTSQSISIDKLEFPNVTDKAGIQDAILGLPQLAMQRARSK